MGPLLSASKRKTTTKDDSTYLIMLKNKPVCRINRGNGIAEIHQEELMPFDLYLESGINADTALEYMCLSLKDFYWAKKCDNPETWEEINLFEHSLSNAVVSIALAGQNLSVTNKHLITSDLTTDGLFPKAWYRKDHTFYLYKGEKNDSVNKEVRASQILQQLGFHVLNYEKSVYDNSEVSVSKCFTSNDIGYVTAGDFIQNYDIETNCHEYDRSS